MRTREDLKMYQSLPLDLKVSMSQMRIQQWTYHYGDCFVSFSGGKDSTVLLDIVRSVKPHTPAVFFDTGLEFPEIRNFVKTFDNVQFIKPKMTFREVLIAKGYPFFSKEIASSIYYARKYRGKTSRARRQKLMGIGEFSNSIYNLEKWLPATQELPFIISSECCKVMKKDISHNLYKQGLVPFLGTLAEESKLREQGWLRTGCNAFDSQFPHSMPLSFWREQDILAYIKEKKLKICSLYGDIVYKNDNGFYEDTLVKNSCKLCTSGFNRTGCMFCGFGAHLEKPKDAVDGLNRFQRLAVMHPATYDYLMRGGQWVDNPQYDSTLPKYDETGWKIWNPKKIWIPSSNGLGYKFVIDSINEIYGKDFIKY